MFPSLWIAAVCLSLNNHALAQTSLTLSPAAKASGAKVSSPLDASFAGFGIEPSNLFSFTGHASTNSFSVQLLQNLADYSGAPPHIRLGGNTADYCIYQDSYSDYTWGANAKSTGQGAIASDSAIIGPTYFKALDRLPENTPVTFGLNLAYEASDYIDNIVKEAQAALDNINNVKLYSFEIGNEPDLYLQNAFRTGSWSGSTYTQEFLERASAVYEQVLKPAGIASDFFEAPTTASTIGTSFEIDMLVNDGLTATTNGSKFISAWNQHNYFYFISVSTYAITLDHLMDLDNTNTQFAYWETQVAAGLDTGLPYVLREMSSVGPIGMHGVSDTFGAALWTLNFFMYMASLNVSSVQMHMTDNSNASAWQPVQMYGNAPFVRPQYYAHAAVAQLIGNGNGTTQIAVLDTSDNIASSYKGRLRAFAAYANSNLQAMVLINSLQANASNANKGSFTFNVNFGTDNANKEVFLSYLTADGADSFSGTTWNGMQYSNSTGKASTVNDTVVSVRTSSSGSVSIPVRDSQAIIANVGSLLGNNAVISGNGTTSSGKKSSAGPTATSGAQTAVLTGIATTTLALASSVGGAGNTQQTGASRGDAPAAEPRARSWWTLAVCLTAVIVGFALLA